MFAKKGEGKEERERKRKEKKRKGPDNREHHYLHCFLVVLDIVSLDVVMGTDWLSEFRSDYHSGTLGARTTGEEHDSASGSCEGCLQKPDSDTQGHARAPERTLVVGNWPRILLELLD